MSVFHRHVPPNPHGRDFVVSDLHGHLPKLQQALAERSFIPGRDRLFSVGDLVDRGPDSPGCVALLRERWFHAVRGNHEDMLLRTIAGDEPRIADIWAMNGGRWGLEDEMPNAAAIAAAPLLAAMPWALTLHHKCGLKIGICHAQCPVTNWALIDQCARDEEQMRAMLWGRDRLWREDVPPVDGIDLTIHGHTVVRNPHLSANALFLETGAYLPNGRLALLCVDQIVRNNGSFRLPQF
jgi:serine/threonine protein phosphatase 1